MAVTYSQAFASFELLFRAGFHNSGYQAESRGIFVCVTLSAYCQFAPQRKISVMPKGRALGHTAWVQIVALPLTGSVTLD